MARAYENRDCSQIARDSFGRVLDRRVPICIECRCAEHGAPVGRSPPEEHYAEAEGSSGRWTKAFPARRILGGRALEPRVRPFFSLGRLEHVLVTRSSTLCEKKTSQIATSMSREALTQVDDPPSVRLAPSTERPRLMVLRVAPASAEVSRIAGRRRHRLGAFLVGPVSSEPPPVDSSARTRSTYVGQAL